MGVHDILMLVYEIQGIADPNHPDQTLKERMGDIFTMACGILQDTGFMPDDALDQDSDLDDEI